MRRGILGGTFDPIHTGHLILAQEVQWRLGLDEIWFVPTGEPWMKRGETLTGKDHRKAMVEIAVAENPKFRLSTVELERPGETYTVETLETLKSNEWKDDDVMFIVGVDAFNSFHRWKDPRRILELVRLVVALRPGYGTIDLTELQAVDGTAGERVMPVEMPLIEISGSELRRRAAASEPLHYLVPDKVRAYIETNGLYR